jgi:cytochrome c5
MASSSRLKPGERGKIKAAIDIKGKLGKIFKTVKVYTNDPKKPVTTLSLRLSIEDQFHVNTFSAKEIFNEQCKSCHVELGKGKKGFALFNADCIMCHFRGKSAQPILEMRKKSKEYIAKAIREGINNTSMPGFALKNGGPLSDEEIESLVAVIKPQ